MKRSTAAILLSAFLAPATHAGDYWMFASDPTVADEKLLSGSLAVIDASTIVYTPVERKAWNYLVSVTDNKVSKVSGFRHAYRCDESETATLQWVEFDPETLAVKDSHDVPVPKFSSPVPGTLLEGTFDFVCLQKKGQAAISPESSYARHVEGTTLADVKSEAMPMLIALLVMQKLKEEHKEKNLAPEAKP